ncbi:diguanylate cyclase [Bacillus timonensis]|nr:diguanylate cyclase [Bacillus timonensis]
MQKITKIPNIYLTFISLIGVAIYASIKAYQSTTISEWVIIFALTGSILLLNYHPILIPPKGNSHSMDSSIYLASLFIYGLELTLNVLLLNAIISLIYQRNIAWWKHTFNFGLYTVMIFASYSIFVGLNGTLGTIQTQNLIPYLASLTVYFITNILLISIFFQLSGTEKFFNIFNGIVKDITFILTYFTTLLLSLVLGILITNENFFGLFLFVSIAMLLSKAFDHHFQLFSQILNKANKDYLTGLNNHGYFKEMLENEVKTSKEREESFCLALLDLDDFKRYNDLYGHIQGDNLLTFFGSIVETECQSKEFMVARYGGEEFAILMPKTSCDEAFSFVDHLRKKVNDSYFEGVESLPYGCLSFSAGLVESDKGMYDSSELISKADQAMYYAKAQGKNIVQKFDSKSQYIAEHSLGLDQDLNEAEQQLKIFLSKDVYTYRHSKRVFQYAVQFSQELELSEVERKTLILGALIHDIGKLEIPRDVINKKGKLEPHEWEMIKKHVTWGKEIISTNKKLEPLIPLVELHHERYDGKGYPYGLKGENTPKLARILCIIDSFDAMTTERPYQPTKTFTEAITELRKCSGYQFDPEFVEPFITMIEENYSLKLKEEASVKIQS